jgi:hypothetical protein
MVPQIVAGLQKANFNCEIKFLIFMAVLNFIPFEKKNVVGAIRGTEMACK